MRVNISLPKELVGVMQDYCEKEGFTFSGLIHKLLKKEHTALNQKAELERMAYTSLGPGVYKKFVKTPKQAKDAIKATTPSSGDRWCKHGMMKEVCKFGCK